jgi:hypothetical protein
VTSREMTSRIEERILVRMPELFLAGIVPAAACAALAHAPIVAILAMAAAAAWALGLIPLALACLIVVAMKGPARSADSYPLP